MKRRSIAGPVVVRATLLALAAITLLGSGCSARQAYEAGQTWQRNPCLRLADAQDRQRCLERVRMDFDQYQKESGTARGERVEPPR